MASKGEIIYSPKKESVLRELSGILTRGGFTVRREPLKRGVGWKAVSGTCRLRGDSVIFVDRRLSQDEQISFLVSKIHASALALDDIARSALPGEILDRIQGSALPKQDVASREIAI